MVIVLTYDPSWEYSSAEQKVSAEGLSWESLDTVEYVAGLLSETGNTVLSVKSDLCCSGLMSFCQ
jgi:hypothetical protein